MINKQEAIDVMECYRRNMAHILGEGAEQVKIIDTCINLVDEVEDQKRWIPCNKRLPEEHTRVIGYMAWKAMTAIEYQYGKWYSIDHLEPLPDEAVIAWMPLPEPYEENEG